MSNAKFLFKVKIYSFQFLGDFWTINSTYRNFAFSEMREIRGLLLRPRRASRESLPPNPVSDTL